MEALNERRRQVLACLLNGMNQAVAGKQCGVSVVTVWDVWKRYQEGGRKAIEVGRPGRPKGKGRILTSEQEREAQK